MPWPNRTRTQKAKNIWRDDKTIRPHSKRNTWAPDRNNNRSPRIYRRRNNLFATKTSPGNTTTSPALQSNNDRAANTNTVEKAEILTKIRQKVNQTPSPAIWHDAVETRRRSTGKCNKYSEQMQNSHTTTTNKIKTNMGHRRRTYLPEQHTLRENTNTSTERANTINMDIRTTYARQRKTRTR